MQWSQKFQIVVLTPAVTLVAASIVTVYSIKGAPAGAWRNTTEVRVANRRYYEGVLSKSRYEPLPQIVWSDNLHPALDSPTCHYTLTPSSLTPAVPVTQSYRRSCLTELWHSFATDLTTPAYETSNLPSKTSLCQQRHRVSALKVPWL
jgi:hypothetical protein